MRFGERYADGKTITEILHVVQNDGLGDGAELGGPWEAFARSSRNSPHEDNTER